MRNPIAMAVCRLAALLLIPGCYQSFNGPRPIVTEGALTDVRYEPAQRLVSITCADCHTRNGNNETQPDAWGHAVRLDTYKDWLDSRKVLLERLDPVTAAEQDPPVDVMPQTTFKYQLTDTERDTLLQWIKRGSPNTESGF
ncbi:MAG: hypothetical protein JWO30_487 [Fibrobacteres bacterium]|nr:hypothetical protein [Fibrobacterota bacterium]